MGWADWRLRSSGGASRAFLVVALVFCAGVSVALVRDGRWDAAALTTAAAVYFLLRSTGLLGRKEL